MSEARRIELSPLRSLKPNPDNPKGHDGRLINASFARFGFVEPILVDERTGMLLAGHGRTQQLLDLLEHGKPAPAGVEVEPNTGEWLVPVVRGYASSSDVEARAYLIASNRLVEAGGWEQGKLDKLLLELSGSGTSIENLLATGFGKSDVDAVLEQLGQGPEADDDAPMSAPAEAPWVVDGILYALGAHRLLVGDSLLEGNRKALIGEKPVDAVVTDPPYVMFGSSNGFAVDAKMALPFFQAFWRGVAENLREAGHGYVFTDWRTWGTLEAALGRVDGLVIKNGITWDKGRGLGVNYANATEWVMFVHRVETRRTQRTLTGRPAPRQVHDANIFRAGKPQGDERLHNAAKPVEELRRLIKNSTDAGARVWEPFSGSGSTLIACEREGRVCLAGECDPVNAQITIERWQKLTGKKAAPVGLVGAKPPKRRSEK